MIPSNNDGYCTSHSERGEQIECAREQVNTLSADVRVLTSELRALGVKIDAHLTANDNFMPRINDLITQVKLIEQRVDALWKLFWSVVSAVAVAAVMAYVKFGGAS